MLVTVLNCYQRDEVKWRDMSAQIIDLLLPLLANQKVMSAYGVTLECQTLMFDSLGKHFSFHSVDEININGMFESRTQSID